MQNTVIPPRPFIYLQFIPYKHIKDTLGSLNNQVLSNLHNPFLANTKIWSVEKNIYFPLCDNIPAWRTLGTEEPGRLQSMGSQSHT